jgi:hypothetical protein
MDRTQEVAGGDLARDDLDQTVVRFAADFPAPFPAGVIEHRHAPYDFTWSWGLGFPPLRREFTPAGGRVVLEARSGSVEGELSASSKRMLASG